MAVDITASTFQQWGAESEILDSKQRTASQSSSLELFDADDKVKIVPSMEDLKEALQKKSKQNLFDERYMSSEEALSPMEPDVSDQDYDLDDLLDDTPEEPNTEHISKNTVDLAIAVAIISAGRPKVVDVPPSPTTTDVGSDQSRQSSLALRKREKRPMLPGDTFDQVSATTSTSSPAASPNHSREDVSRRSSTSLSDYQFGSVAKRRSQLILTPSPVLPQSQQKPTHQRVFLSTDPFATHSTASLVLANLDGKPRHSRLRSLSQKIPLIGRKPKSEEGSPVSPTVSQKRRKSIGFTSPTSPAATRKAPKLQARGAAEREPTIEIPPCPFDADDDAPSTPRKRGFGRKEAPQRRKSLLGLG